MFKHAKYNRMKRGSGYVWRARGKWEIYSTWAEARGQTTTENIAQNPRLSFGREFTVVHYTAADLFDILLICFHIRATHKLFRLSGCQLLVGRSVGEGKLRDSGTRYKEGPLSGHVNKVGFRATFSRPQLEMGLFGGFLFVVGLTQVCGNMDLYLAESEVMKLMGNWQKRIRRELYLIRACGYWFPHSHSRHVRPAILRETRTGE